MQSTKSFLFFYLICAERAPFKDSTNLERWKQLLDTSLEEQASWQDYISVNKPDISLQPFDTIEGICQGKVCIITKEFCVTRWIHWDLLSFTGLFFLETNVSIALQLSSSVYNATILGKLLIHAQPEHKKLNT